MTRDKIVNDLKNKHDNLIHYLEILLENLSLFQYIERPPLVKNRYLSVAEYNTHDEYNKKIIKSISLLTEGIISSNKYLKEYYLDFNNIDSLNEFNFGMHRLSNYEKEMYDLICMNSKHELRLSESTLLYIEKMIKVLLKYIELNEIRIINLNKINSVSVIKEYCNLYKHLYTIQNFLYLIVNRYVE